MTRALCIAMIACASVLASCSTDPARGYSSRSTFAPGVRTVAVPVFENQTFYPGLERDLADALVKEIQRRTPMVVVQPRFGRGGGAQTTLSGVIRSADRRPQATSSRTGLVQEQALELVVDFDWRDDRAGTSIERVTGLRALESFVPARPVSGPLQGGPGETLDFAQKQLAQELATKIVARMRADW